MERQEGDDAATAAAEEEVVVQIGAKKHDPTSDFSPFHLPLPL
jgi:hypothetical protein